ncbi:anti-anti-sigma factor [Amycolatopsis marina]|uniref:Anti-sigma factor antagonist n=1 Tax=Amycolatopsis marina TaxID=490629 RepID=A0A1I1AZP1_9PSEU|nr:STAS domain-containing protein [Amycolatopsis marina]SFB41898.1 anti-anti-sigma factor [Amycolatopsis marina]
MTTPVPLQRRSSRVSQDYLLIRSEYVDTIAVIRFDGDIDALTGKAMSSALATELDCAPAALIADLSAVEFLGCAGLSVLAETDARSRRAGIPMCVVSTRRAVLRPLFVSGLRDRLRVRPSLSRALLDLGPVVASASPRINH